MYLRSWAVARIENKKNESKSRRVILAPFCETKSINADYKGVERESWLSVLRAASDTWEWRLQEDASKSRTADCRGRSSGRAAPWPRMRPCRASSSQTQIGH